MNSAVFAWCPKLKNVVLGNSVNFISGGTFLGSDALTKVSCLATMPPTMERSNCFSQTVYDNAILYVPAESLEVYSTTDWWNMFSKIKKIGDSSGDVTGDVNGDGELTIADANAVINIILTGHQDLSGDINGDGEIGIADVNAVIDLILNS